MDKELQKLINEYMPKRYYGHEARRYAGVIAKLYLEKQSKLLIKPNISDNEDNCNIKQAIEILDYHQKWRLGKVDDMIYKPLEITAALDVVLKEVKKIKTK